MTQPTMRVLFGPPGTGKTWQAARDAVRLISPAVKNTEIMNEHRRLVAGGRIIWVTFHPGYSYEDFVEGFRPVVSASGITYEPKPGPFKIACSRCSAPPKPASHFALHQTFQSDTGQQFEVVEIDERSMVLRKLEGKGAGQHSPISFWLVEQLVKSGNNYASFSKPGTEHSAAQAIADSIHVTKSTLDGVMAALRATMYYLSAKGWPSEKSEQPVVLVIDEISRADLSRVFGELVTLIEPDKRLGQLEERRVILPYSQENFGIPANLHIIGTMNTADRSLTLMDHALRRRFDFVEVPPDATQCAYPYGGVDLRSLLDLWNERIAALVSRDHRLGHAYFMPDRLESIRTREGFVDDQDGQLRAIAVALRRNIIPLLSEYFHDDWRKSDIVFGKNFNTNKGGILEEVAFKTINESAGEVVDLEGVSDFRLPPYWDPHSVAWNAGLFRSALGG